MPAPAPPQIILFNALVNDVGNGFIGPFPIVGWSIVDMFVSQVSFVGGASPTVTLDIDSVGPDGNTYNQIATAALSATAGGAASASVGLGTTTNKPIGSSVRVHYAVAGAPTSLAFYVYLIAR